LVWDTQEAAVETMHKQVTVEAGGRKAEVDEKLAPLIAATWEAGVSTQASCENYQPGMVWVVFPSPEEALAFMNLVTVYEQGPDTLYARMTNGCYTSDLATPPWSLGIFADDDALFYEEDEDGGIEEGHDGVPDVVFRVKVLFPRCDLPVIVERLRKHNAQRAAARAKGVARGR
jgi:hypothetical protein